MPALAGDDDDRRLAQLVGEPAETASASLETCALGLAALVVGGVELGGDRRGASGVVGAASARPRRRRGRGARRRSAAAPRRKAMSPSSIRSGSTLAAAISARRPARGERRISSRPRRTRERFSSTSGTRSATVARATRSRSRIGASGRPVRRRSNAWTSLCGDRRAAEPARTGSRRRAGGRSGSRAARSPGWWWSVTTTAIPAASIAAISATEAIPQSAVISRPVPRSLESRRASRR